MYSLLISGEGIQPFNYIYIYVESFQLILCCTLGLTVCVDDVTSGVDDGGGIEWESVDYPGASF